MKSYRAGNFVYLLEYSIINELVCYWFMKIEMKSRLEILSYTEANEININFYLLCIKIN